MIMKKILVVIKSIVKARDPGEGVGNEVINSEILNLSPHLRFDAQIICNLVSRGFPLFDMKRYLFCRVLPHIN